MNYNPEDVVKEFEGLNLNVYNDVAGNPTIGYGHLIKPGESFTSPITQEQADTLLAGDLSPTIEGVKNLVTVAINDNQLAALVSLAFNIGLHAFATSSLLKSLNAGKFGEAAVEFLNWCHSGVHVVRGLLNRRMKEKSIFLTPEDTVTETGVVS